MVIQNDDAVHPGSDLGDEAGRPNEVQKVKVADVSEGEVLGSEGAVDGVGEEGDGGVGGGGGREVEVGGECGERAVGTRIVVENCSALLADGRHGEGETGSHE